MVKCHHFYIRAEDPEKVSFEISELISTSSILLDAIAVTVIDNGYILPARNDKGHPLTISRTTDSDVSVTKKASSEWYILNVEPEFNSDQARNLAALLMKSYHVDLFAEDNTISANSQSATAEIIGTSHWLMQKENRESKSPSEQLSLAISIASNIHLGQFDRGGKPYILHPLHLMQQLLFDHELAAIAVLHDVIEDGDGEVTLDSLKASGFSSRVVDALSLLTHKPDQDYMEDYIEGICTNYDAIRVKRKDLEHNSNITRLKGVRQSDFARAEKYHKAFIRLGEAKLKLIAKED